MVIAACACEGTGSTFLLPIYRYIGGTVVLFANVKTNKAWYSVPICYICTHIAYNYINRVHYVTT